MATSMPKYAAGTTVSKNFHDDEISGERPFSGKVTGYDADEKLYKIVYEDGDNEESESPPIFPESSVGVVQLSDGSNRIEVRNNWEQVFINRTELYSPDAAPFTRTEVGFYFNQDESFGLMIQNTPINYLRVRKS